MAPIRLRQDVTIGPLLPEYADAIYRWVCDPTVSDNLGLRHTPSLERTIKWLRYAEEADDVQGFAVLLGGQHVGNVVIDRIDDYMFMGRLSVYIGDSAARSAGVGITGMYLAIRHCFIQLGLHKIWLTVHIRNHPAIQAYNKLGFMLEGILRDEFWLHDARVSALYMGLLCSDFESLAIEWVPLH